jgi:hypothetical protein
VLVKFEIYHDGEYWCARGIGVDIFTQGKTLDELMKNIREAVEVHFDEVLEKGETIKILSISENEIHSFAKSQKKKHPLEEIIGLFDESEFTEDDHNAAQRSFFGGM